MDDLKKQRILSAMSKNALFKELTDNQLEEFISLLNLKYVKADETIINEGSEDKTLYILVTGAVAVTKYDPELKKDVRVVTLHSGDSFGEMNLFDESTRFATVKAIFDCELIALTVENMDFFRSKGMSTYSIIMTNVAKQLNERLRRTTAVSVSVSKGVESERFTNSHLKHNIRRSLIQLDSAKVFIFSVYAAVFYVLLSNLLYVSNFTASVEISLKGLSLIAIFLLYTAFMSTIQSYTQQFHRLYTFKKSEFLVLAITTIALLAYFSLFAWVTSKLGLSTIDGSGFLSGDTIDSTNSNPIIYYVILSITIIFSSFVQEYIMRLGFYIPMVNVLRERRLRWLKIFISSLLLITLYSKFQIIPIVLMTLPCLVWGYLFSRGYNVLGLAISHSIFNLWGAYVLTYIGHLII